MLISTRASADAVVDGHGCEVLMIDATGRAIATSMTCDNPRRVVLSMPASASALSWLSAKAREYRPDRELHLLCSGHCDWLQFGETRIGIDEIRNDRQIRADINELGRILGEHVVVVIAGANLGLGDRGEILLQQFCDLLGCEVSVLLRVKPSSAIDTRRTADRRERSLLN